MPAESAWPRAAPVLTARLRLEPLQRGHAREAVSLLADEALYTWTGGSPGSLEELADRYSRQSAGQSPDGTQGWLNWMLRRLADERLVGTVQATLQRSAPGRLEGELAWVVGTGYQRSGFATEGALAMAGWLRQRGVSTFCAHIHPGHVASMQVAKALGMTATSSVSAEGEVRWTGP